MNTRSYNTVSVRKEDVKKNWLLVDAENLVLGRLSSQVAILLRGKHKPDFTPHVDGGDYVIVVNAEKVRLTGKKRTDKVYIRHTGYPGGRRYATPEEMLAKNPTFLVTKAVKNMLPKTRLGNKLQTHLFVYAGNEHPHTAQNPKEIKLSL